MRYVHNNLVLRPQPGRPVLQPLVHRPLGVAPPAVGQCCDVTQVRPLRLAGVAIREVGVSGSPTLLPTFEPMQCSFPLRRFTFG